MLVIYNTIECMLVIYNAILKHHIVKDVVNKYRHVTHSTIQHQMHQKLLEQRNCLERKSRYTSCSTAGLLSIVLHYIIL